MYDPVYTSLLGLALLRIFCIPKPLAASMSGILAAASLLIQAASRAVPIELRH